MLQRFQTRAFKFGQNSNSDYCFLNGSSDCRMKCGILLCDSESFCKYRPEYMKFCRSNEFEVGMVLWFCVSKQYRRGIHVEMLHEAHKMGSTSDMLCCSSLEFINKGVK